VTETTSRSAFLAAQQAAEADGREVVATMRGALRATGLVALCDAMGIAYGADVRIQGDATWWYLTAPKGWENAPPVYPDRDERVLHDEDEDWEERSVRAADERHQARHG
jgi:hypothetical protein